MSDLESNKALAAILTAGIAFSVAGVVGGYAVHPVELKKTVLDIKEAQPAASASPEAPKPLAPIAPLLVSADVGAGEGSTKKLCVSCHNFNEGGANKTGPDLYGVLGRQVASHEGFDYSAALKGKQGPWTYAELNEWLHSPRGYAPGTKMGFAGIENDHERANVIAYLRSLSASPEPLPTPDAAPAAATPAAAAMPAGGAPRTPDAPAKGDSPGTKANAPVVPDAPTSGVTRPQAAPVNGAAGQANAPGQQMTQPSSNQNIPQALQSESQQSPYAHPAGPAQDTVPASQQVGHPVASPTPASTTTPVGVPDGHANAQTPQAMTDGDTVQQRDQSQGTNGGAPGK